MDLLGELQDETRQDPRPVRSWRQALVSNLPRGLDDCCYLGPRALALILA